MSDIKIEDNFIEQEKFDELQDLIFGPRFSWKYGTIIDYEDLGTFQFTHLFYAMNSPISNVIEQLNPILQEIKAVSIWQIKANLLTKTPNIIKNTFHVDMGDKTVEGINEMSEEKMKQWATSIFYMNTNNGYTEFEDGTKVESVANRIVTFPANIKHRGTSCTDEKTRVVINFNYFASIYFP